MLWAEEINMAVCQAASERKQGPQQKGSVPCQHRTLPEIKGQQGPRGKDADDSSQRPCL